MFLRCYSAGMSRTLLLVALVWVLGAADTKPEYEMTSYVVGFFHRGPNAGKGDPAEAERLQEGHLANFGKLVEAGKLIVAGPFSDNTELRGMLIFKLSSVDEARTLIEADPMLKAGRLTLELHPWFAGAGLRVNGPKGK
jgi:uncharacterized protein